jgi:hypothetical protein
MPSTAKRQVAMTVMALVAFLGVMAAMAWAPAGGGVVSPAFAGEDDDDEDTGGDTGGGGGAGGGETGGGGSAGGGTGVDTGAAQGGVGTGLGGSADSSTQQANSDETGSRGGLMVLAAMLTLVGFSVVGVRRTLRSQPDGHHV